MQIGERLGAGVGGAAPLAGAQRQKKYKINPELLQGMLSVSSPASRRDSPAPERSELAPAGPDVSRLDTYTCFLWEVPLGTSHRVLSIKMEPGWNDAA